MDVLEVNGNYEMRSEENVCYGRLKSMDIHGVLTFVLFQLITGTVDDVSPTIYGLDQLLLNHNEVLTISSTAGWCFSAVYVVSRNHFFARDILYRAKMNRIFMIIHEVLLGEEQICTKVDDDQFPVSTTHLRFGHNGQNLELTDLNSGFQVDRLHRWYVFRSLLAHSISSGLKKTKGNGNYFLKY